MRVPTADSSGGNTFAVSCNTRSAISSPIHDRLQNFFPASRLVCEGSIDGACPTELRSIVGVVSTELLRTGPCALTGGSPAGAGLGVDMLESISFAGHGSAKGAGESELAWGVNTLSNCWDAGLRFDGGLRKPLALSVKRWIRVRKPPLESGGVFLEDISAEDEAERSRWWSIRKAARVGSVGDTHVRVWAPGVLDHDEIPGILLQLPT